LKTFENPGKCFRLTYPPDWNLADDGDHVSLWHSKDGGAVTISSARHRDPKYSASAIEHCKGFVSKSGDQRASVEGNTRIARGRFTDSKGIRWYVHVLAHGRYGVLATYNYARKPNLEEDEQAVKILDSITIIVS